MSGAAKIRQDSRHFRRQEVQMSGLGGLNKSPAGVVIGMVQLQLPTVTTPAELAAQTGRIVDAGRQGAAQPARDGPGGVPRILAARALDEHRAGAHVPDGRPRGGRLPGGLPREPHLGLLLADGGQPGRQPVQHRHHPRRPGGAAPLLPQAAPLGAGRAVGAGRSRHPRLRRTERQPPRAHHLPRRHVPRDGARVRLQGRGDHPANGGLHRADPAHLADHQPGERVLQPRRDRLRLPVRLGRDASTRWARG